MLGSTYPAGFYERRGGGRLPQSPRARSQGLWARVAGWPREGSSGPFPTPPRAPHNFPDAGPPLGAGRRGRGRVLEGSRPPPTPRTRQGSHPRPPAAAGTGGHAPGWAVGRRSQGPPPRPVPPPAGPAPPRRGAEGGRGGAPRVSLSLRHWPRSWRRRSGRYSGPGGWGGGASRELVPGRALSPSSAWPELGAPGGEGASARARAALLPLGRAASGLCWGRRGRPLPGLRRGLSPTPLRELPRGASRLLCPSLGPCPSPPGFPEPAPPGEKPGGNLGVRGGAPVQPPWLPGRAARCGPGPGCGSGHESGWRWEFPQAGPVEWRE